MSYHSGVKEYYSRLLLRISQYSLSCIFLAGLLLRLAWSLASNPEPLADFLFYYEHAGAIASGLGYTHADGTPTAYWPVGYPAFLAILFWLFGKAVLWGKIANVILSALTIPVFYYLALNLTGSIRISRLSALVLAIYPNQIFYTSLLSDSILFQFLMFSGMLLLIAGIEKDKLQYILISAVIWAGAVYIRPYAVLIPMLVLWFNHERVFRTLASAMIIYSIMIFLLTPWIARNYQIFGGFVFISANSGVNLLIGNNPQANGTYKEITGSGVRENNTDLNEYQADSLARHKAMNYIMEKPGRFINLIPAKLFWMFADDTDGYRYNLQGMDWRLGRSYAHPAFTHLNLIFSKYNYTQLAVMGALELFYLFILGSTLYYIIIFGKKEKQKGDFLIILIIGYFALIAVIFFGTSRFHFPLLPFLILLSAKFFSIRFKRPRL